MLSKNKERIENIDILRGVAIIFIVLYHYTAHYSPDYLFRSDNWSSDITKHLWVGVDIFFILSGYCIAMTIFQSQNYIEFLMRRFARIYPAYVFCGLITLIFYSFFDLPGREVDWYTGFMNFIFANFVPGLNFQYIDGVYWMLIVELKFYIFFGMIYFFFKDLNKSIISWVVFSILLNIIILFDDNIARTITSISPHANWFLVGLMIFSLKEKKLLTYFLTIIFVISNIVVNERFIGYELSFIFIVFFIWLVLKLKLNLRLRLISKIGLISFSWYLLHNSIGIIMIREINKLGVENFSVIIATISTLLMAAISFKFIELPMKKNIVVWYMKNIKKINPKYL
tara:strand:+ start:272 stop:1294 length:1023 start_codon:yes stop_codon:yes gene_type:complete